MSIFSIRRQVHVSWEGYGRYNQLGDNWQADVGGVVGFSQDVFVEQWQNQRRDDSSPFSVGPDTRILSPIIGEISSTVHDCLRIPSRCACTASVSLEPRGDRKLQLSRTFFLSFFWVLLFLRVYPGTKSGPKKYSRAQNEGFVLSITMNRFVYSKQKLPGSRKGLLVFETLKIGRYEAIPKSDFCCPETPGPILLRGTQRVKEKLAFGVWGSTNGTKRRCGTEYREAPVDGGGGAWVHAPVVDADIVGRGAC